MRTTLLLALLTATFLDTACAQALIGGDWRADLDDWGERLVEAGVLPGMGVAVVRDDWIIYSRGFGLADTNSGRPVDEGSYFYIASTTKALTATAVVLQAHDGKFQLSAPVWELLPELAGTAWQEQEVTLHDLLAMRHGMQDGGPVVFRTAFSGEFDRATLLRLLGGYQAADSGKVFNYGNLGYNVLGLVLSAGQGGTWKEVVTETVLMPLGMTEITPYVSRIPPGGLAMPHTIETQPPSRIPLAKADANLHAAGGHFTTARSLARFVAAHLSHGLVDGQRLLPAEPLVLTQQRQVDQNRTFAEYRRTAWGYGWDIGDYEGETIYHRFGGFSGYFSHMSFMPEHGLGVVVLANAGTSAVGLMANFIYERLLGRPGRQGRFDALLEDRIERNARIRDEAAAGLAERRERLEPLPHPLSAYAGSYHNDELGTMTWRVIADGLEVRMGVAHSRAEVYDATNNALRVELTGGGSVVQFLFDDAGNATAVRFGPRTFARRGATESCALGNGAGTRNAVRLTTPAGIEC